MHRVIVMAPAIVVVMVASSGNPGRAQVPDPLSRLEADTARAVTIGDSPFQERVDLVDRLRAAQAQAPDREQRARLALAWLQSLRWLLAAVPFGDTGREPYRRWLTDHDTLVVYSEPAGQWLVSPEAAWKTHDAHRGTAAADDIAWFAVTNGYPGECEGYVPCYANMTNWLEGEYLRRHAGGRHVGDAIDRTQRTLESALTLMTPVPSADVLNPATDCGDLKNGLEPLRDALRQSDGRGSRNAVALVDRLLAYCR